VVITATELKNNLGKYLDLAQTQEVLVSKNGKLAAKLVSPFAGRLESARTLVGILPPEVTAEEAREARLGSKWQSS